jgi:hypothetical protein
MAGILDWLKGGRSKSKGRVRPSSRGGRSDSGKRRGAQRRDPSNSTEFIGSQPVSPTTPPAHQAAPVPPPLPPVTPAAATPAPPPAAPAQDAGATQYHSVGSSKSGLVGVLIVTEGAAKDEIHKVFDGENTIGRGEAAEIRTDNRDDAVSREHAMIIHESGNFGIKPLKEGTNPTFLNNNEVSGGATLADGDLIRVGNTTLKFRVS